MVNTVLFTVYSLQFTVYSFAVHFTTVFIILLLNVILSFIAFGQVYKTFYGRNLRIFVIS
jgi:hypothetical protein